MADTFISAQEAARRTGLSTGALSKRRYLSAWTNYGGPRRKRLSRTISSWISGASRAMKLPPDQPHRRLPLPAGARIPALLKPGRGLARRQDPHIQNVAVGGVANAINLKSEAALNFDRLFQMKSLLQKIISFVQNV